MTTQEGAARRHIHFLKLQSRISFFTAAATALSSLYILTHMDDGDSIDLHKQIPQIVEKQMQTFPDQNRASVTAQFIDAADKGENLMRLACAVFSVTGLGMAVYRDRQLRRALDNGPR